MSFGKKTFFQFCVTIMVCSLSGHAQAALTLQTIAKQLGWITADNKCGGYFWEPPITYANPVPNEKAVLITGHKGFLALRDTSTLEKQVTLTRGTQQITSDKATVYRNVTSGKLISVDMFGDVHLREPNTLLIGNEGHYNLITNSKAFKNVLYRTAIGLNVNQQKPSLQAIKIGHPVSGLSAWGDARELVENTPLIYESWNSSFSTCSPLNPTWRIKAKHIVLNKNTGRGYATHARLYLHEIPVVYFPYYSFSIDKQRKSGFLWPTIANSPNNWGPYLLTPFYLNLAPNYDMIITPGFLTLRGIRLTDDFRYLSTFQKGKLNISVLPDDLGFKHLQHDEFVSITTANPPITDPSVKARLTRLLNDSPTRKGFFWRDDSRYNAHWSSHIDFNYAGDDYYMRDFGNLNELTQNQLLQEADLYFKSENWYFSGSFQAYQTLHPVDEPNFINQYRRFPQLVLNANYPDQLFGLNFFVNNEATHFDLLNTPGTTIIQPVGDRFNIQPGISWPFYRSAFYFIPRIQVALTQYHLTQTTETETPSTIRRAVPIFDIASGIAFNRNSTLFHHDYQETLEPQFYYTYIPYRNQSSIPDFDTTDNILNYDQLFNYNRFSGIDRIGDANQLGVGITSRFIDVESGLEKIRVGIGEIIYFANRRVTLCNNATNPNNTPCTNNPDNPDNKRSLSPISAFLNYNVSPVWNAGVSNLIWNPITKDFDNATIGFHYQPAADRIINLGFSYARNGDILSGLELNSSQNNLKLTDFSIVWPLTQKMGGVLRWSQNWNLHHLQNLIYGVQYDTCCFAIRLVGGHTFTHLNTENNNQPVYNNQYFLQFDFKGLGEVSTNNPDTLLSTINGYRPQFSQETT